MKLYELIKPIDAPNFTRCIDNLNGQFPESILKRYFNTEQVESLPRFFEFFKESETHKIEHCKIVRNDKANF